MKIPRFFAVLATLLIQPLPAQEKWFEKMDVGPAWMNTFGDYFQGKKRIGAVKGLSVDLGDGWRALYDTETLRLVSVSKGGIEWGGTPWTGQHGRLITMNNKDALLVTGSGPGWADRGGSFADTREIPGYGNMADARFTGHYRHGREVVLAYTVNGTDVLETISRDGETVTRSFRFDARPADLTMVVADGMDASKMVAGEGIKVAPDPKNEGRTLARITAGDAGLVVQLAFSAAGNPTLGPVPDFNKLTSGGPGIWPEILITEGKVSADKNKPYVTDLVSLPSDNPWGANLRFGGFDFIDADSAALSSWNGDVWIVRGLAGDWKELKWQRIASGLFETLGVKVVDGTIHVNGRDQITKLIDLNGDGETDHFQVFNRDVYVSENFHEFAFDLQTDKEGNFYFSKGAPVRGGGRGFDRILPHHGIVAKISPDGKKFEVLATGLRAPGGVGIGPNGEITTGENEGTWQPACKINFVKAADVPAFFGTEPARHSLADAPFTEPLMYLPMDADNSGGSQVWVPEGAKFGLKAGELLHLSYGKSSIYRVLPVSYNGKPQAGAVKLPIQLQSSAMRARFHEDGSMYVLGFRGWQTNAATECAFQRIRYNAGAPAMLPEKLGYSDTGVTIAFPVELDDELAEDVTSYSVQRWDYVRGPQYGSGEFSVDNPDAEAREQALAAESKGHRKRDKVNVLSAKLSADGKSVELALEGMKPAMGLKIGYDLEDTEGEVLNSEIHATVYGK
ncbi:hypothetical protein HZ994_04430 [Akkermansiaceae bacterium]|nr:hypothetical protein HZ994_04430 [Akkermansiaceae bacterium]